MTADAFVRAARERLARLSDPAAAPVMQRYMKSTLPFRGVKAPEVKSLTRELCAEFPLDDRAAWEGVVRRLFDEVEYREEWYVALGVAAHRRHRAYQTPESLQLYRQLASTGAWWDVVDSVSSRVGDVLLAHRPETTPLVRDWASDTDFWMRRVAILSQRKHRAATDSALLADVLSANLDDNQFFVRKAIGWALREYARTDASWVRLFVDEHRAGLSALSKREALKHIGA